MFTHDAFCCAAAVACQAFLLGLTVSVVCQLYRDGWGHAHVHSSVVYIRFGDPFACAAAVAADFGAPGFH